MLAKIDWNDKEQALKAMQEYWPKKELWNLEIAYDIFLQSQKDENAKLKDEVDNLGKLSEEELIVKPTIQDFDGYEYDTSGNVSMFTPEEGKAMDWFCKSCNIWQPMNDPKANNVERHEDGVYCKSCFENPNPNPTIEDRPASPGPSSEEENVVVSI
jgi:hypothetical protein